MSQGILTKKGLLLVSVVAALGAGSLAEAAAPFALDQYSVANNGATVSFNATCPVGFTCAIVATADGYLQRSMSSGGDTYIQTLISEVAASMDPIYSGQAAIAPAQLTFADESIVRKGTVVGSASGVASKARIAAIDSVTTSLANQTFSFQRETKLLSYSFWTSTDAASTANVVVDQINAGFFARSQGTSSTDFFDKFHFEAIRTSLGAAAADVGKNYNIAQLANGGPADPSHKQRFNYYRAKGSRVSDYAQGGLVLNGTSVTTSAATTDLAVSWLGQNYGGAVLGDETVLINGSEVANKTSFVSPGFSATVADSGFDWDPSVGTGVFRPTF